MKKIERTIYIVLIIVLVAVIASGVTYIFITNKDNSDITNEKDSLNNVTQEKYKISDKYSITLNGQEKILNLEFTANSFDDWVEITGKLNDLEVYGVYGGLAIDEHFNISKIKKDFNENNFRIIKGLDNKEYLVIISYVSTTSGDYSYLYIFNDKLELINKNFNNIGAEVKENATSGMAVYNMTNWYLNTDYPKYEDQFGLCNDALECQIKLKIEDNKLYYLIPVLNEGEWWKQTNNLGVLEERIYTINNDKLEYSVINEYKIIDVAGDM